jgi:hypothetical protein
MYTIIILSDGGISSNFNKQKIGGQYYQSSLHSSSQIEFDLWLMLALGIGAGMGVGRTDRTKFPAERRR